LVDSFYGRLRAHPTLGPVFHHAIGEGEAEWAAHLARLKRFWSAIMFRNGSYQGDPFSAHLRLPDLRPEMFSDWLALFDATAAELFEPSLAAAFSERAHRIARSLRMGIFERLPAIKAS
ncbi:MAG TPA: group III truncated hemoglobin, partial [Acetobacteraceae bacterium]|nr:group III truncated hemoglobin [Acetobacteraceae bacterium]